MMAAVQQKLQVLFVAWQQSQSRRFYPVARLVAGCGEVEDLYEFAYIKGAWEAETAGFNPFPAFPVLTEVYRSRELFPFFSNRLLSANRPEYSSYVQSLGLDLSADPMLILVRSGGGRATDSVELFSCPDATDQKGVFRLFFWMHGFRYLDHQQQQRVLSLQNGEELSPIQESDNAHDPHAIRLQSADGIKVGYVPRYLASDAVPYLSASIACRVFVDRVNPPPAPAQQRLLCRLEARWPEGLRPFMADIYQPTSPDATDLRGQLGEWRAS